MVRAQLWKVSAMFLTGRILNGWKWWTAAILFVKWSPKTPIAFLRLLGFLLESFGILFRVRTALEDGDGGQHSWGLSLPPLLLLSPAPDIWLEKKTDRLTGTSTLLRHTLRSFFVPTRNSWTAVGSFSFSESSSHCLQTERGNFTQTGINSTSSSI